VDFHFSDFSNHEPTYASGLQVGMLVAFTLHGSLPIASRSQIPPS